MQNLLQWLKDAVRPYIDWIESNFDAGGIVFILSLGLGVYFLLNAFWWLLGLSVVVLAAWGYHEWVYEETVGDASEGYSDYDGAKSTANTVLEHYLEDTPGQHTKK